jgi:hypothetical protein
VPYDANDQLVRPADRVSFGERRYERFKFATVVDIDDPMLEVEMKSRTRTIRASVPAAWVEKV